MKILSQEEWYRSTELSAFDQALSQTGVANCHCCLGLGCLLRDRRHSHPETHPGGEWVIACT